MKTKLSFLFLFSFIYISWGQNNLTVLWQDLYGGIDSDKASDVINTSDNNLLWIGQYKSVDGDFNSNYGNYDAWVTKTERNGNAQWKITFGGSNADYLNAVTEDANGDFVLVGNSKSNDNDITGNHGNYDILAVKISPSGNILWQKSIGGSEIDKATSVLATSSGEYLVLGYSKSTDGDFTANSGNYDIWLLKLDASGTITWQQNYGGANDDRSGKIIALSDGNYLFSGYSKSNNGDLTVNHGNYDYWIVKIDPAGNIIWQKSLGGSDIEKEPDVIEATNGGYVVAGYSNSADGNITNPKGNFDFWMVYLDNTGNMVWEKSIGGTGADFATAIGKTYITNADVFTVIGYSNSDDLDFDTNQGSYDAWLVTIGDDGSLLTKATSGGSDTDRFVAVSSDVCFIAGTTKSNDGNITGANGNYDAWLLGVDCTTNALSQTKIITANVYPNPSLDFIYVEAKNIVKIQVIDINGKILINKLFNSIENQQMINIRNLKSGSYFIEIYTKNGKATKKLFVQ